ncbi:MAG: rhomboid family intramembrane serine protease [Acidobacteria bacterium]|nr:rhomboid family intramembrane serine protease [Acidobacteriota bacterium]
MHSEEYDSSQPRQFVVCQNCGQIIPSQSQSCEYCGAASAVAQQMGDQQVLHDIFNRAAPVTPILIGVNVAIYLLMTFAAGGDLWRNLTGGADTFTLLAFGAQNNELLKNGEWFRLITPAFIHIGLLHLIMNSYVLWTIGPLVEKLYGMSRFLGIYLLSAAGGSLASFINHSLKHDTVGASAGASGAIFGLFGVIAVFSFRYRDELPPRFLQALKSGVLPAIGINLLIGYSLEYVDNAAHIGGLLTGGLLALVIPYIPATSNRRASQFGMAVLALCVAVILTSFALTYWRSTPLLKLRQSRAEALLNVRSLLNNVESARQLLDSVFSKAEDKADWKPSLQDISQLTTVADALKQNVGPDAKTEKIRVDFIHLLQRQKEIISQADTRPLVEQLEPIRKEFLELDQSYITWLKTDGPTYGFTLREKP